MNRVFTMKDRRLIEALDYIDDEYIASAALYKMRSYAESVRPLAQTAGQSVKKHWKHYLGFVACLLVLALAAPLFGYLPEIINSFAAGWGEGSGDETTEEVPYLQFSPDLEPISQELVDEINEAFAIKVWGRSNEEWKRILLEEHGESLERIEKIYRAHYKIIRNYDCLSPYFGTFKDCVVFATIHDNVYGDINELIYIEGYEYYKETWVYKNGVLYNIVDAYEQGLFNKNHLPTLSKRYQEFVEFKEENELIMPGP